MKSSKISYIFSIEIFNKWKIAQLIFWSSNIIDIKINR